MDIREKIEREKLLFKEKIKRLQEQEKKLNSARIKQAIELIDGDIELLLGMVTAFLTDEEKEKYRQKGREYLLKEKEKRDKLREEKRKNKEELLESS